MAFWNRRHDPVASDDLGNVVPVKSVAPNGAKAAQFSAEYSTILHQYGWGFASSYGEMYRRQPAVRTVVDFLADNIAQLNLKTYLRIANADREEINDHALAVLIRNPNPQTSRFRFMRDTVADIAIYDRAYWLKRRDRNGFPAGLIRMAPAKIRRESNSDGTVTYRQPDGGFIPRSNLVVFSGYNPTCDWNDEEGVSPLETLRRVLEEEWASQEHRRHFWRNAARRDGVIQRPLEAPPWTDPARARFRTDWEATHSGAINAGRTPVLEEGMTWNADAFSPKDSEYIAGRQLTFEEVAQVYQVNPKLRGMGDVANANIESFHRQLYQDTLGPWLRELQDDIELQLLPDLEPNPQIRADTYTEFNLAEKLKGSFEEQMRSITTAVGVPWLAINEGRAIQNRPRVDPEATDPNDIPVKPLNVMYGNQPAVTVPTEVPQPGTRSAKKKAGPPAGALRRRQEAAKYHTELFRRYFNAQRQAVAKKADAFDMERWDGKLAGELYAARIVLARKTGKLAATQINGVYDEVKTFNFLQESARREAVAVNAKTAEALDGADDPASVFDIATSSRAERLGLSTATAVIGFARAEAAKQSVAADGRQRTKTWVVTSAKSRHPEMNGETVNFDESFSNNAQWPGDSTADVDEVANCQCLLSLGE